MLSELKTLLCVVLEGMDQQHIMWFHLELDLWPKEFLGILGYDEHPAHFMSVWPVAVDILIQQGVKRTDRLTKNN